MRQMRQPFRWHLTRCGGMGLAAALLIAAGCGSGSDGTTEPPPPATGSLTVNIGGLPSGTTAAVTVTGPGGFSRILTATETLASLTPGAYTVTGASVTTSGGRYGAVPASQPVTVVAGANPVLATVTYALATGSLTVNISGLAAGINAQVTIAGPAGFTRSVSATQTLSVLEPGPYMITAVNVTDSENQYLAVPPTQGVSVSAGTTAAAATVLYAVATGRLTITLSGVPSGANANVSVTGPGGFSRVLTTTTALTLLAPGNYTVTAGDVLAGNFTYRGVAPLAQVVAVPASTTPAAATVRYTVIDGAIALTLSGLPNGVSPAITITRPGGFSQSVSSSTTLARLAPGTYTVTAPTVTVGATTYAATPDIQTITLAVGATANVTVTYGLAIALRLEVVTSGLSRPVQLTSPPNDNTRLLIVEQTGLIRLVKSGQLFVQPFLDLTTRITVPSQPDDERGLLGMAVHPQYATNGYFFVYFNDPFGNITIERFQVSANPDVASPTGTPVLVIPHFGAPDHNGGAMTFGPDGLLYLGIGDGGCCKDPFNNAQNTNVLLGKILRIAVAALPYAIPPTNPFANGGGRPEIYAYGLRNPWRIDIDANTNTLYIADVGEDNVEEVHALTAGQPGANLGWPTMEGSQCLVLGCSTQGLTLPVITYGHSQGCSITGGFVYRGTQLPELAGHYFYSDYCSAFLRSFLLQNGVATQLRDWGITPPGAITSFGEDASGELYILTQAGGVFRIVRQ